MLVTNVFFFFIVDQKLEVKYHRYHTGRLFKKVTNKLDTGEIQILFPDGIICGWKLINSDKIFISQDDKMNFKTTILYHNDTVIKPLIRNGLPA